MCRKTQTAYLLCRHTTSSTSSCLRTRANSIRSLFSSSPTRKCTATTTTKEIDDYCPTCTSFWEKHFVSEHSRRFRVQQFRSATGYTGSLTPIAKVSDDGEAWFFGFVMDDEPTGGGGENGMWRNAEELELEREAASRKAKFVSKGRDDGWEIGDYRAVLEMDKSRAKPPSISSRDTAFPGEKKRRGPGPDEFGHDSDPDPDDERGSGIVRPDVLGLRNLERGVSEPELRPAEPLPSVAPQRGKGDIGRSLTRRNNWQEN